MVKQQPLFTIQQLSLRLSIPRPTLRFWEKELDGIIVPLRTCGGQRRYTAEHISIIEEIQKLKRKGMSLAEIKRKLGNNNRIQDGNSDLVSMDLLVNRIAEVVKAEISSFLQRDDSVSKALEVDES